MKLQLQKGFKQFLLKTTLFVTLFMAFSFIIGQKMVSSNLLTDFKLEIYGRMGYIILFTIAAFILLYRERLLKLQKFKYEIKDGAILLVSFILLAGFYYLELNIEKITPTITNILLVHALFFSGFFFLLVGIYGIKFIYNFIKEFKKELLYFLIFAIITGSLMETIWKLWPYFSLTVLKITEFLLRLVSEDVRTVEPMIIIFKDFGAQIGEACSGIYSIFLFSSLYLFIIFLDWKKINKKRATLLFFPAVIGAFLVNVLRVFLLFIIGAYISKEIALGLYHSYIGMIFFLIYFAIFWVLAYRWMKNQKQKFLPKDPLYQNSIYIMLSMLVMSSLGFVFWMINARLFTTEEVGLATTILSVSTLLVNFSLLGLAQGLIRYLPKSKNPNKKINTCFTLITIVTIIASSLFLLSIKEVSPKLLFIKENAILSFIFIIFMVFSSWNSLIEIIFIAYRKAKYILLKNTIFSILKIIFPFLLISLGAYGIFSSWMAALSLGFIYAFIILIYKFRYKPKFVFHDSTIKQIGKYSFGNYIAGFLASLPTLTLPLILTNKLDPETTAYYYMAMMIANLLFIIPNATSNSLFAEGSHNKRSLKKQVKKSAKLIALFMIPAITITVFLGKYILLLFGQKYSQQGYQLLSLLAISGIFMSINAVFTSIFRVKNRIKEIVFRSFVGAIVILGLSLLFIRLELGLIGVGIAWAIGQATVSLFFLTMWIFSKK
jgi:exosortase/archaeosortase family protein